MKRRTTIAVRNDSSVEPYPGWRASDTCEFGEFLLSQLGVPAGSELSVCFVDPEPIAQLHEQWLDLAGPTDVMAFPMDELREGSAEPGHLGDVVVCPQVAAEQAAKANHSPRTEVELLMAHGVLHLLGHDHTEPAEHELMFAKQASLLQSWAMHIGAAGPISSMSSGERSLASSGVGVLSWFGRKSRESRRVR